MISMLKDGGTSGLISFSAVVQTILVVVADLIGHTIPSIRILTLLLVDEKFLPLNVMSSPPSLVPHLGLMDVKNGVLEPLKV